MRAVFLAAIMLTSIVGGTMAFTGAAAAITGPASVNDVEYESGIAFQGQNIQGEMAESDGATLRSVSGFDSDGAIEGTSFVEELDLEDLDGDGDLDDDFVVDTDDLEAGDYIVVDDDGDVNLTRDNTFEVTVQDLSAEFEEDDLPAITDEFADSTAELDVSSARNGYSYNVSADGNLERDQLFNLFTSAQLDGATYTTTGDLNNPDGSIDGTPTWVVDNEGALSLVDSDDGQVLEDNTSALELSFDSPWNALENSDEINFGLFGSYSGVSDLEVTHDGDVLNKSGVTTFDTGAWDVAIYGENADDYENKIVVTSADTEADVSFIGADENDYTFEFDVTDTEASATADASTVEQDLSASFDEGVSQTAAGDIAEFTLELEDTDETWVQIGGEDSDFVDVLYLEADDTDEPMTVEINTRTLGTGAGLGEVYSEGDNVATIESEVHGGISTTPGGAALYEDDGNTQNFDAYLDNLGIINSDNDDEGDQLTRPLQATDYEITVGGTDVDTALFDSDAGGDANDELASKVLELQQPEIGDIVTHTAPSENADDTTNVSELVDSATAREEIAVEDQLIVQVEATGIYGALVAGPNSGSLNSDFDRLEDGTSASTLHNLVENTDSESINFEIIAEETTGNQEPLQVDLEDSSDSDVFVVLDEENGQFFVVVDTSSDNAFANGDAPDEETAFTAELEYDANNGDNRYEFRDASGPGAFNDTRGNEYHNYPYLLQGETLSSSTEVDLTPRNIDFDNVNVDDLVQAENIEDAEFSGTTNVAPGTEGELRVSSTDASSTFRNGQSFTVGDEGEVSGEFDFSNQEVDDEFETAFRIGGSAVDTADSIIVEEGTLEDEAPEDDDESESDDGESDDGMTDDGESDDSASDDSESDDSASDDGESDDSSSEETPGFGAIVALVAVLGAALLATRRQN